MPAKSIEETRLTILKLFLEYGNAAAIEGVEEPFHLDIFENEFVDSFSITSLIALIEDSFDITFTTDQLNSDRIRTIHGLSIFAFNLTSSDG